ncbi:MAG: rhodanese-like domain-containing protein [Flavobacteriales bacterium]|nr:rhodanese-like domain-containing protein [Flavobacteriales bacterium]
MNYFLYIFFAITVLPSSTFSQEYKNFTDMANRVVNHTIPLIKPEKVKDKTSKIYFLDAREKKEFFISHIENAQCIGYDFPDFSAMNKIPANAIIVVYCSVGYRSEKMAEKIKAMGYKNVFNLYGGIFNWANLNFPLVNAENKPTNKVHGYSQKWEKWLLTKNAVYE